VLEMLNELSKSVRVLTENQERLMNEQARCGKAIGEAGALLTVHAHAIAELARHTGLPVDDSAAPNSPVN
jgi:hypothetical protein